MFSKTGIEKSTKGKDYKTLKGWNYGKYAWITVNAKLKSTLPSYFMHFFSHLLTILFLFPIIPEWVLVEYKHIKGLIISDLILCIKQQSLGYFSFHLSITLLHSLTT